MSSLQTAQKRSCGLKAASGGWKSFLKADKEDDEVHSGCKMLSNLLVKGAKTDFKIVSISHQM